MDGQTLHAALEGAIRDFHGRLVELRNEFAGLPNEDGEKVPGLEMVLLWDTTFHNTMEIINAVATAQLAIYHQFPVTLVRMPETRLRLGAIDEKGVILEDDATGR